MQRSLIVRQQPAPDLVGDHVGRFALVHGDLVVSFVVLRDVVTQEAEMTGNDQSALVGLAAGGAAVDQVKDLIVRSGEMGFRAVVGLAGVGAPPGPEVLGDGVREVEGGHGVLPWLLVDGQPEPSWPTWW
ncbi:hypothetical protein [Kibdelosporangium persicum]|uniref:hypothetical protein n=1 Tax=Kibdelosporangium persicum TaxID=2698649 RepID=UPI0015664780|nr:hypothetical protein [Kibdelosporangium persicum]